MAEEQVVVDFIAKSDDFSNRLSGLDKLMDKLRIPVDTTAEVRASYTGPTIDELLARGGPGGGGAIEVPVRLQGGETLLDSLRAQAGDVSVDVAVDDEKLKDVATVVDKLDDATIKPTVDSTAAKREVQEVATAVDKIDDKSIKPKVDNIVAKREVQEVATAIDKADDKVIKPKVDTSAVDGLKRAFIAAGGAAAVIGIGRSALADFKESTEAVASLTSQLKRSERAIPVERVEAFADAMQGAVSINDEAILGAYKHLSQFENLPDDQLENFTRLAADMSAVMGGDLAQNAELLGEALNSPETAMRLLREAGVRLTDQEKDQIAAMADAGNMAAAQGFIFEKLAGKVGGAAAEVAARNPAKQLELAIGNAKENLGGLMTGVINEIVGPLATISSAVADDTDMAWQYVGDQLAYHAAKWGNQVVHIFTDVIPESLVYAGQHLAEWAIAGSATIAKWAVSSAADMQHFLTVVFPAYLDFAVTNSDKVWADVSGFFQSVMTNMSSNAAAFADYALKKITFQDAELDFSALTEGFKSQLADIPLPTINPREVTAIEEGLDNIVEDSNERLAGLGDLDLTRQEGELEAELRSMAERSSAAMAAAIDKAANRTKDGAASAADYDMSGVVSELDKVDKKKSANAAKDEKRAEAEKQQNLASIGGVEEYLKRIQDSSLKGGEISTTVSKSQPFQAPDSATKSGGMLDNKAIPVLEKIAASNQKIADKTGKVTLG